MPIVKWNARDENANLIEVQAEIVEVEAVSELTEPSPELVPDEEPPE